MCKRVLSSKFKQNLNCTDKEFKKLWSDLVPVAGVNLRKFSESLKFLLDIGVRKEVMIENITLATISKEEIKKGLSQLKTLNPRDVNDFIPLLSLSYLTKAITDLKKDAAVLEGSNRIYYLSEKLNVEPDKISKLYANNYALFQKITFPRLNERVDTFLKHGVAPEHIFQHPWALQSSTQFIDARLLRIREVYAGELRPWMALCSNKHFARFLEIKIEQQFYLHKDESVSEYLARKLDVSMEIVRMMIIERPGILSVKIRKLTDIIDYVLSETNCNAYDIALHPIIFFRKLDTIKRRNEQLKLLNHIGSSLDAHVMSEAQFEGYVRNKLRTIPIGRKLRCN